MIVDIGKAKKISKFNDFSIAIFNVESDFKDSFENTGYIMAFITMLGKKKKVSKIRYPAPYHPTAAVLVSRERRTVSRR